MQPTAAAAIVVFSVLFPSKLWFAPDQPLTVTVRGGPGTDVQLILTDFVGKQVDPTVPLELHPGQDAIVDLKHHWPQIMTPSTYLLYAVPKGASTDDFVGTPLVFSVRADTRRDAPPGAMVTRVSPLCYAVMTTDKGQMTCAFYYDAAPNTVDTIVRLAAGGFYDGLTFHRIVPGFVIQGGDPVGNGTGGPGFTIDAEFSDREHRPGVMSMARESDTMERQGAMPRPEAANSAGSQFFICLDYARTRQLDRRYTVFGKVVDGMDVVNSIASVETDPATARPRTPVVIHSMQVMPVLPGHNPYPALLRLTIDRTDDPQQPNRPATQPVEDDR